jgi:mono/diheme cytochrome c family protein
MEWGHPENPPVPEALKRGAAVFEAQCVSCHKAGGNPAPMALTTIVNAPDAESLIRVTFQGIEPPRGTRGRNMPGRALQISDADMVALAAFVRARFSKKPAWTGVEEAVRKVRAGGH